MTRPRVRTWLLVAASVLFAFLVGGLPTARASANEPPAVLAPPDAPVVLPSDVAPIPPVPSSYVTKTLPWLELSYPASASERVEPLLRQADSIKAELSAALGQEVLSHVTIRVAPTVMDMARLAPPNVPPPAYASGVAYHGIHLVLLSMLQPRGAEAVDLDEVLRHELVHVALEDAVLGKHVPLWFNEGLAVSLSGELAMARTKTLWDATLSGTLLPLSDLERHFPTDHFEVSIAYAESADFMRFLSRRADRVRFASLIDRVRSGQPFDRAVADAYGGELRRLEFEWRAELERRFSVLPALTGGAAIWLLVMGILIVAYVRRRRRSNAILARWAKEEALEDAWIEARRRKFLDDTAETTTANVKASYKVEREGTIHTLH
jgi:hypothetical protein